MFFLKNLKIIKKFPSFNFSVHIQSKEIDRPITLPQILEKYQKNIPLSMLTAHDYSSGYACDQSLIDMVLVGDSLSMTALGHQNTLKVTMKEMIHHAKAVKKGVKRSFLIGDMPFGSYFDSKSALKNAAMFIRDSEMNSIKLEGGRNVAPIVKKLVKAGIVVFGHIGLTPQHINNFGGFKVFGSKEIQEAINLWEDAKILRDSGASLIVLECVPERLANLITKNLGIPTIGIGSGANCSGQVLVFNDLIGIYDKMNMKFCKKYLDLNPVIINACKSYKNEVERKLFPVKPTHTFIIKDEVLKEVTKIINKEVENNVIVKKEVKKEILNINLQIENIVILGAGSLGSLVAAKLSKLNGKNVRLISGKQSEINDFFNINVSIDENFNQSSNFNVKTINKSELETLWGKKIDLLIICCKNYATEKALENFLKITEKIEIKNVISFQNGFGNLDKIQSVLNNQGINTNLFQCSFYSGVKLVSRDKNHINISQSISNNINIALPQNLVKSEIENLFKSNEFQIINYIKPSFIDSEIYIDWEKIIINSVINPLTGLFNIKNLIISENDELIKLAKSIIHECIYILKFVPGAILAINKDNSINIEEFLLNKVIHVSKLTGSNTSSTLTDLLKNEGETEIDSFNGSFVKIAQNIGLAEEYYSVNKTICNMVKIASSLKKI